MNAVAHNLRFNGAAFDSEGELINSDTKVTAGAGRAKCSCGWLSVAVATGAARRAEFKAHKAEALAQAPAEQPEPMFEDDELVTVYETGDSDQHRKRVADLAANNEDLIGATEVVHGQDVAAGTPEDEVAEALAEVAEEAPVLKPKAKRAAKRASKKAAVPVADGPADEPNAASASIPFTTAVADSMWRFLGRAAVPVVDELHPTVQAKADNNGHIIRLSGPKDDVHQAELTVKAFWLDAINAVKGWKETDKDWAARPKGGLVGRKASYFMTGDFYISYADTYVAANREHA